MSAKQPGKSIPQIVSAEVWQATRKKLLVKEKAMTRALDALSAERRRLPMVLIDKKYLFDSHLPSPRDTWWYGFSTVWLRRLCSWD
jgi:predicted dithiol-disulfide oxidoreductase (DUF899 family)